MEGPKMARLLPRRLVGGLAGATALTLFGLMAVTNALPAGAWSFAVTTLPYTGNAQTSAATPGASIHDTAVVDETTSLYVPTGTVTFTLYEGASCTGTVAFSDIVNYVNPTQSKNSGANPSPTISSGSYQLPTTIASSTVWSWQATFFENSSDKSGVTQTSPCDEPVDVTVTAPTAHQGSVSTTPNQSTGGVGAALTDTAVVTGIVNPAATDTVTFSLYLADLTNPASCTDGTLIQDFGASSLTGGTSGPWSASSNGSASPTVAGTYLWLVQFNAVSDPNNLSSQVFCGEPVTITGGSGQLAASTTTPDTGSGLGGLGLLAGLVVLLGGLALIAGVRFNRRFTV